MRKNKIRILHVAQAAGGVDRYIRMLLKYLDKEKFENLAEGIGVSKQTMSKIMNGARAINAIELHKISEYLHVSMDSLMKMPEKPMDTNVIHAFISNNPSLNSVHQYTHQPIIQPLITPTLRSASGQGERPRRRPRVPDAPRSGTLSHMKIYVNKKK